jgi:NAD(P)-dependent dehydrogenase (short-subunit alcohol dehydrogenase family)
MIEKEGRQCLTLPLDLTNVKNVKSVVDKDLEKFGSLDILVNNASRQVVCKNFADIDLGASSPTILLIVDSVEETFRTNILQMFALTKFAVPHLKRGSSIINTTSVTAYRGSPAMIDYTATKGAIVSFTRALAASLAPKGIRVNAVAPGPVFENKRHDLL